MRTVDAASRERGDSGSLRHALVALGLALAFSLTGLSNHPLRAPDEPRVAGIAWEMQHAPSSFVPHLGGEPFLEHPPLFYVLLGEFMRQLGATDGVARLPGALASAATLLLVFALAARLAGPRAGLAALLSLVCMRNFYRYSHRALVDPLLALFVLVGFYAYVRAVWTEPDRGSAPRARVSAAWLSCVYVAAALAFYVKGFIGIVAVAGPLAVDAAAGRRRHALLSPVHLLGLPLLALVCCSWPWWLHHVAGEAALRGFLVQNGLYRIFPDAGPYTGGHAHPWWYYLPRVPREVGGPLLFAPALAFWLVGGNAPASRNLAAIRFLASVLPIGILLLSIPGTKRDLYVLPFLPPFAVAAGAWVAATALPGFREGASRFERLLAPWSLRLLGIGFAASLAWNVLGYPFAPPGRDLGPLSREVGARVGGATLAGFRLPEAMRGALSFYTGRVVRSWRDPAALSRCVARGEAQFVLTPSPNEAEIEALPGVSFVPSRTWQGHKLDYILYTSSGR